MWIVYISFVTSSVIEMEVFYYLAPGGGCDVLFSPCLSVCLSVCVSVCLSVCVCGQVQVQVQSLRVISRPSRWLRRSCIAQFSRELRIYVMEFVAVCIVYPGIFGVSGVFFRYSWSLCLKVFTVHRVRPRIFAGRLLKSWGPIIWKLPSLIVLIVPVTRRFIWGNLQSRPCLVDMRVSMPTFLSNFGQYFDI